MADSLPPLCIGSDTWPGLGKLAEECAEVTQVAMMLLAFPDGDRPDGSDVVSWLHDELGDVMGAVQYVLWANQDLDRGRVALRAKEKLSRFQDWHRRENIELES